MIPTNGFLRYGLLVLLATDAWMADLSAGETRKPTTFCNPIDLGYRFYPKMPSRREAADPVILRWKGKYWLFASKSGGYWQSENFASWQLVEPQGLPLENYAPTAEIIGGKLYFTAGSARGIFSSDDPASGQWTKVATLEDYTDPALFADQDGRLYMYHGTSNKKPMWGVELNSRTFAQIGDSVDCVVADPVRHGWELKKLDANNKEISEGQGQPFLEGLWMTKHNGTYYLQYAAPGTERKWYADGVYTSNGPLGPFEYAPYNPFCQRSTGFLGGTGHGNTFQDEKGNYWHSTCALVGVRTGFERRIAVFPLGFVPNAPGPDQIVCETYLGDYPQYLPGLVQNPLKNNLTGWMLLSYEKKAEVSSTLAGHPSGLAFDEDIRTWWAAATGDAGEWLSVDLGKTCEVRAVQVNFADEGSDAVDRLREAYRYKLELSEDGRTWTSCVSREQNTKDSPHDYIELEEPMRARYVRLTNLHTPAHAKFSVSGLRLFGSGLGQPPSRVGGVEARRLPEGRRALVRWDSLPEADFYIIRYGIAPDRLFLNAQVYKNTEFELMGLNTEEDYWVTVDAINDSGITKGIESKSVSNFLPLNRKDWIITASASSSKDSVANVLDGEPSTRWGTGTRQAPGQWLQIDIRSPFVLSQIDLESGPDHARGYEILLSMDGENWQKPSFSLKGTKSASLMILSPQLARYVRLVQTGRSEGPWWSIYELQLYGSRP